VVNLNTYGGSKALIVSSIWTGLVHLILAILGTFVLKRFPTSFSVGFFLGVLVVLANQNLILFGTFHGYQYGALQTNNAFSNLAFTLFAVLGFFSLILFHFKRSVVVAPIDAAGLGGRNNQQGGQAQPDAESADYQRYDESS
jgi:hypothetical protein